MRRLKLMAAAAGLLASVAMAPAAQAADPMAYILYSDNTFNLIDLATLNSTSIATLAQPVIGLGEIGNTLYGDSTTQSLYTINPTNGVESLVGAGGIPGVSFVDFGSTNSGSTGSLFAIGNNGGLYSIAANGAATFDATLTGPTGLFSFATRQSFLSLSTNSSTLYLTDVVKVGTLSTEQLFSVNTTSGLLTDIGTIANQQTTGPGAGSVLDVGGTTLAGGTLYGGSNNGGNGSHDTIYQINPGTASDSNSGLINPNNSHSIYGLASADTPEPSAWALMLLGVGAVGGVLRSRRRRVAASV